MNDKIFVTGAAGQLGQLVIKQLLARGVAPGRIAAGIRCKKAPGLSDARVVDHKRHV